MIIINAPLKADIFQHLAEEYGLTFKEKKGMKMLFENSKSEAADAETAAKLKAQFKSHPDLAAVFFQVTAE